jgi:hypothetical protein
VILLGPDQDVQPPVLRPLGFQESGKTRRESLTASIDFPADSSGLAGYSFLLTQSLERDPQELVIAGINNRSIPLNFPEDGLWYLKVILQDRAGNWSEPAVITVNRDRQPRRSPESLPWNMTILAFLYPTVLPSVGSPGTMRPWVISTGSVW